MSEQIIVQVDSDVATMYRNASENDRRRLDLLVNLRLRELSSPGRSLPEVMDEISRNAQQRELTSEILQSILYEE